MVSGNGKQLQTVLAISIAALIWYQSQLITLCPKRMRWLIFHGLVQHG